MKISEICNTCDINCATRNGYALKHIKTHGYKDITEYYYSFNQLDLCIICGTNNKRVSTWDFKKLMTCSFKECIRKNATNNQSEAAKKLAMRGGHNFQRREVIDANAARLKKSFADGTHPNLRPEFLDKLSQRTTERNLTNNPMKNKDIAKKMSISSTGKILSEEHKNKISKGLTLFLSKLSAEEFYARMRNTERISNEIDDTEYEPLDMSDFLNNPEPYIQRTRDCILSPSDLKIALEMCYVWIEEEEKNDNRCIN